MVADDGEPLETISQFSDGEEYRPFLCFVRLAGRYLVDVFEDKRLYPDLHYNARDFHGAYDTNEVIENVYDEGTGSKAVSGRSASRIGTAPPGPTPQAPTITLPAGLPSGVPHGNGSAEPVRLNHASRAPDGTRAREVGFQWQGRVADEIERQGYYVAQGYGREEPDIVVYEDAAMTRPLKVVAVKSFHLVPYSERMALGEDELDSLAVAPLSSTERRTNELSDRLRAYYGRDLVVEV